MKIVTGYTASKHISAADDAGLTKGILGTGDYVLDVGSLFEYEIISNTEIRVKDGGLVMQGRHARIPSGYDTLTIANGVQNQKRNDLIVARYTMDSITKIENLNLEVIQGDTATEAVDPECMTGNIENGETHDFQLYRVRINGITIEGVDKLFEVKNSMGDIEVILENKVKGLLDELSKKETEIKKLKEKVEKLVKDLPEHKHTADDIESGTLDSDRLPQVPVTKGGTGVKTHTLNAILVGNGDNALKNIAAANGAFFATGSNGAPRFGTLPIAQGGTGGTSAATARNNLGIPGACFIKHELNGINVDNTDGNWSVDISESGHGTIPMVWVTVTQFSSGHFQVQFAIKCDVSSDTENRTQKLWIRDRYKSSGAWSNWKEVLTEKNGVQMVKLWENTNASTTFASKSIQLFDANSSEFDFIEVFYTTTYANEENSKKIRVGRKLSDGISVDSHTDMRAYVESDSTKFYRDFALDKSTGKLTINAAKNVASGDTNNSFVIPFAIYGLKGIQ